MASAPSSDHQATGAASPAITFPPRSRLPRGVMLQKLPMVGTTWYERGFAYWMRRLAGTLFLAALLALATGILWLFLQGAYQSSGRHAWFYGLLGFEILFSVTSGTWVLIRLIKHPATEAGGSPEARRWARRGAGAGILARSGFVLAQVFIVLVAALSYGLWLALFIRSFVPVSPVERKARQQLAERLQQRAGPRAD